MTSFLCTFKYLSWIFQILHPIHYLIHNTYNFSFLFQSLFLLHFNQKRIFQGVPIICKSKFFRFFFNLLTFLNLPIHQSIYNLFVSKILNHLSTLLPNLQSLPPLTRSFFFCKLELSFQIRLIFPIVNLLDKSPLQDVFTQTNFSSLVFLVGFLRFF